jgi:hypothetical protein
MVLSNATPIAGRARRRKSLFPFTRLLRSVPNKGEGACKAENVLSSDGHLVKMKAPAILFTRENTNGIRWQGGYKNSSSQYVLLYLVDSGITDEYVLEAYNLSTGVTTYPLLAEANEVAITGTLTFTNASTAVSASGGAFTTELAVGDYIYLDGEYSSGVKIASITDDDNLVLESAYGGTGGAGNGKNATKHFTTTRLYTRQIGDEAYLASYEASNNGFSFDGTTLTNIANFPAYARYLLLDGNRLAVNELFSGEISTTMTDFEEGTGVQVTGRYATSLKANGGIETSSGIILTGDMGEELHKVIPNNASDDVSAETKFTSFNYTGNGIQNTNQTVMGKDFQYIINRKGIIEINPFTGASTILTEDGNIAERWDGYDVDDAIISYDSKHNKIVALVKDVGQFDTMIVVDLDDKTRPISTQPNSFFESVVNINNQLYGGSSIDGKVFKLFDTFSDRDDTALQLRWILEWDALDGIATEDILKQIRIFANLNSRSSMEVNLYKNGSTEAIYSETFTGSSSLQTQEASVIGVSGFYLSGLGGSRSSVAEESTDIIEKIHKTANVATYALEIIEQSVYDFTVYDIIVEYKKRGRLTREHVLPKTLF